MQGWAIDENHEILEESDSSMLCTNLLNTLRERSTIQPNDFALDYICSHFQEVFNSPFLRNEPIETIQRILAEDVFSVTEDEVVHLLLHYAVQKCGISDRVPAHWTEVERTLLDPLLSKLISKLRILSLSTNTMLKVVEPLRIFSTMELSAKYKFDILFGDRQLSSHAPIENIFFYNDGCVEDDMHEMQSRLRGVMCIAESSHPYGIGEEEIVKVSVSKWANAMVIEFDKRCEIAQEDHLDFFKDQEGNEILAQWESFSSRPRKRSIRYLTIPFHTVYVALKSSVYSMGAWGWKLKATPIVSD